MLGEHIERNDMADILKLSAAAPTKVFRTYNASETLQQELAKYDKLEDVKDIDKLNETKVLEFYNAANRQVSTSVDSRIRIECEFNLRRIRIAQTIAYSKFRTEILADRAEPQCLY